MTAQLVSLTARIFQSTQLCFYTCMHFTLPVDHDVNISGNTLLNYNGTFKCLICNRTFPPPQIFLLHITFAYKILSVSEWTTHSVPWGKLQNSYFWQTLHDILLYSLYLSASNCGLKSQPASGHGELFDSILVELNRYLLSTY